jgi:LytS/YehU family sensor histidine kinase
MGFFYLIHILWEKTDVNLTSIRSVMEKDIRVRINNNFDYVELQLQKVSDISSLKNAIARSRTEINQALTTLIAWFGRMEDSDRKDYNIQDAISIVENIFKKQDNYLTTNLLKSFNLKGKTLDSFIDILFILFDNAFKHSKLNEQTKITISVNQESQYLYIDMKNNVRAYDKLENLNKHINSILADYGTKQATLTINKEGKTGFNKIWKLLSTDLQTEDHYLNAKFIEENNKIFFEVNLKMNAKGLLI